MHNFYDQHLHSAFSSDSDTPAALQVKKALELQLSGICFTEHLDPDYPECPDEDLDFSIDFPSYITEITALQKQYGDRLSIGLGLEFGIQSHLADTLHQTAISHPFDLIIASSHVLNGMDPYYPEYFEGRSEEECYREFLEAQYHNLMLLDPSDFDILGHLDYIVRYGPDKNHNYTYRKYADILDATLEFLIHPDKCLEVNTGGLKYGLGETNPSTDILRRYRELGGTLISLGSDAHVPEYLAYRFEATAELLRSIGYKTCSVFHKRRPEQIPL